MYGLAEMFHTPAPFAGYARRMKLRPAAALALALMLFAGAAEAQTSPARPGTQVWYGEQLVELSEVLGGSHYLRVLCAGRGDQRWRDYMRGVISREPSYNAQLVEGFNRGYRQEESRFPTCDRDATQMEAELRARGLRIADGLRARHAE